LERRFIIAANSKSIAADPHCDRLLNKKGLFPIASNIGYVHPEAELVVKYRTFAGSIGIIQDASLVNLKDIYSFKCDQASFHSLVEAFNDSSYIVYTFEGTPKRVTLILDFEKSDCSCFEEIARENPLIRLQAFDLPPTSITYIDSDTIRDPLYIYLAKKDRELYSVRTQIFLKTPHILTYLFSQVMSIDSKEHLNYIAVLKVLADNIRHLIEYRIKRIEKNHQDAWSKFYGERISFLDGGMSRIVSLPGTEPTGIRVGIYTVTPGEDDLDKREQWNLVSYVIGDVLGDRSLIEAENYQIDSKRLQEAARYILEPLTALNFLTSSDQKPYAMFIHGPLQNSFETYDELEPNYIPGLSGDFISSQHLSQKSISDFAGHLPENADGEKIWTACIPVYCWIMKNLFNQDVPVVGVVERARSKTFTWAILNMLIEDGVITMSGRNSIWNKISKYEIGDELLFGCILDEGEYIDPIPLPKNIKRRAHDRWQPVIGNFPTPYATMLKSNANNFPFRVELTRAFNLDEIKNIMSLLYHTSLLLPNYAFPVGIDIADKFAKIPDWLSKGISARLTASVLGKVLEYDDDRLLRQMRQLLARSPRDFFFRPRA